jgi:hypothetical protein
MGDSSAPCGRWPVTVRLVSGGLLNISDVDPENMVMLVNVASRPESVTFEME